MRKWLAKLMVGRYGVDPLTNFLLIVSMVILLVATLLVRNSAVHSVLFTLAVALLVIGYYRIFSRKTSKRYEENQKYLRLRNRLTGGCARCATACARAARTAFSNAPNAA